MSFVDMGLKIEFNSLLDDYRNAVAVSADAYQNIRAVFNHNPVAAVDLQKFLDQASFDVYITRKNLFDFFMDNLDHFTFDTADAGTADIP